MGEEQEQLENEDDLSDEDFMPIFRNRLRARRSAEALKLPPVPNPEGKKLMGEGHFGTDQFYGDRLRQRKKSIATSLMWRELGIDTDGVQKRAGQSISQVGQVYSRHAKIIIARGTNACVWHLIGPHSKFSCGQDHSL